jgi:hypothetical protein
MCVIQFVYFVKLACLTQNDTRVVINWNMKRVIVDTNKR